MAKGKQDNEDYREELLSFLTKYARNCKCLTNKQKYAYGLLKSFSKVQGTKTGIKLSNSQAAQKSGISETGLRYAIIPALVEKGLIINRIEPYENGRNINVYDLVEIPDEEKFFRELDEKYTPVRREPEGDATDRIVKVLMEIRDGVSKLNSELTPLMESTLRLIGQVIENQENAKIDLLQGVSSGDFHLPQYKLLEEKASKAASRVHVRVREVDAAGCDAADDDAEGCLNEISSQSSEDGRGVPVPEDVPFSDIDTEGGMSGEGNLSGESPTSDRQVTTNPQGGAKDACNNTPARTATYAERDVLIKDFRKHLREFSETHLKEEAVKPYKDMDGALLKIIESIPNPTEGQKALLKSLTKERDDAVSQWNKKWTSELA